MTYWNGPTAPEAVIVRSFGMYLYVPEVCPELLFVRVTLFTAGAAIVVMSVRTASSEADGASKIYFGWNRGFCSTKYKSAMHIIQGQIY